ncbi:unnamed protein product [Calypogeia fissa]
MQLGLSKDDCPLALRITRTKEVLRAALPLADIPQQPGYRENSCQTPLILLAEVEEQASKRLLLEPPSVQDRPVSNEREERAFFELLMSYLEGSGLEFLYCRSMFWKQFNFLDNLLHIPRNYARRKQNPYMLGWCLGWPGSGNSVTTLAFLSTIDLGPVGHLVDTSPSDYGAGLFSDYWRHHIVFVDGYTPGVSDYKILSSCVAWLKQDFEKRRLIFSSSMGSRGQAYPQDDRRIGVQEFFVDSWDLKDYLAAVEHDDFYNKLN